MGFDNFSFFAPWQWLTGPNPAKGGSAAGRHRHRHRLSKKHTRPNGSAIPGMPYLYFITPHTTNPDADTDENDGYYPGLVNISGTYCFMNSTLQVRPRHLSSVLTDTLSRPSLRCHIYSPT